MFCPKCGTQLSDTARFCNKCGTTVVEKAPQQEKITPQQGKATPVDKKRKTPILLLAIVVIIAVLGIFTWSCLAENVPKINQNDHEVTSGNNVDNASNVQGTDPKQLIKAAEEESEETEEQVINYDGEIKKHYALKKEYEMQIKLILLANLEQASFIEYAEEKEGTNYRKMLTDALIVDSVDNPILSETLKSSVDAICEKKSVEEIVNETKNGLINSTKDYVVSSVKDAVAGDLTSLLDCQLFNELAWVNEFLNVDDTPIGLLNGMISLQKDDVELLLTYINQEEYAAGKLPLISGLYKRICQRQEEIISAGGTAVALGQQEVIDEFIEKWKSENAYIYVLDTMKNAEAHTGEQIDDIYSVFRNYEMRELPSRYDVAAYREQQKYTEQAGMATSKIFGDLLGGGATDDLRTAQKQVQENRIYFYSYLEGYLESSYGNLCNAKENFDKLYDAEFITMDLPFEKCGIVSEEELNGALDFYLEELKKYNFNLKLVTLLWANTLSEKEDAYVENLNQQVLSNNKILEEGANIGIDITGYDMEEENGFYINLLNKYVEFLNISMVGSINETTFSIVSNVTTYSVGNFDVYYKGQNGTAIILAEEDMERNWHQQRYLWIYDTQGNPIYIQCAQGTVYIKDGEIVEYISTLAGDSTGMDVRLYDNAVRIMNDLKAGTLERSYKNYVI